MGEDVVKSSMFPLQGPRELQLQPVALAQLGSLSVGLRQVRWALDVYVYNLFWGNWVSWADLTEYTPIKGGASSGEESWGGFGLPAPSVDQLLPGVKWLEFYLALSKLGLTFSSGLLYRCSAPAPAARGCKSNHSFKISCQLFLNADRWAPDPWLAIQSPG